MFGATRQLTLDLVAMPSVNGTPGESAIIEFLYHRLTQHPAYLDGRMHLFMVPAKDDPLFRPVLIAHMPARTPYSGLRKRRGVLLFGHTDTVGTADFGALESLAFRPLALTDSIKSGALDHISQERAKSGKWLFGRGILDMKSGVAAALTAFETMALNDNEIDLFFSATPDEESGSLGVKTLSAWLDEYLPAEQIDMQAAINTDYTTWHSGDGGARHIYLGSIGKLLPAVYVRGVPSHAAEPESGIDPNLILAAITDHVVYNHSLRDADGEETCPYPVCLYQRDDKLMYDVQTAVSASAYYNLFHMKRRPTEQLGLFMKVVRQSVTDVQEAHPHLMSHDIPVVTYSELWREVSEDVQTEIRAYANALTISQDLRERCRLIVERLLQKSNRTGACVVVYFGNGLVPKVNSGDSVRHPLHSALTAFGQDTGEKFLLHRYFSYISDLSFLTPSSDWDDQTFQENFPSMHTASPAPSVEVPTLMVGTYGFAAHRPQECVDTEYTFGRLPVLLTMLTQRLGASQ